MGETAKEYPIAVRAAKGDEDVMWGGSQIRAGRPRPAPQRRMRKPGIAEATAGPAHEPPWMVAKGKAVTDALVPVDVESTSEVGILLRAVATKISPARSNPRFSDFYDKTLSNVPTEANENLIILDAWRAPFCPPRTIGF